VSEIKLLREEVELRVALKALRSSDIQQSEVDEFRKEFVQLRRQADYNSDEIKKIQESIRKEAPSE